MTTNPFGTLKILLAEDNAINKLIGTTMLQRLGFEVKHASNGFEVLDLLDMEDFDVVLMDIQMPEKDGIEATEDIRNMSDVRKRNIPIIALTANALEGEEEKYLEIGMDGYVCKPFRENTLLEAIEKAMAKK